MNELVTINQEQQTVDGRDLHQSLGVKKVYQTWMTEKIQKLGFKEGLHYQVCFPNSGSKIQGGLNKKDYILTLDAAKNLAMVTNTPKGQEIRDYFIKVEKAWNDPKAIELRFNQIKKLELNNIITEVLNLMPKQQKPIEVIRSEIKRNIDYICFGHKETKAEKYIELYAKYKARNPEIRYWLYTKIYKGNKSLIDSIMDENILTGLLSISEDMLDDYRNSDKNQVDLSSIWSD